MATKYGKIKGLVNWAKVYEPDVAFADSKWKMDFYPLDETEWAVVDNLGLSMRKRDDEEMDMKYIKLSRPTEKKYKNELTAFCPIRITAQDGTTIQDTHDKDGKVLKSFRILDDPERTSIGERVLIGNGSEIEVEVIAYDTSVGRGHRIEAIKIRELVKYDSEDAGNVVTEGDVDTPDEDKAAWE